MIMTLAQAIEVAKQASPLPHVAHEAMQVLVADIETVRTAVLDQGYARGWTDSREATLAFLNFSPA